MSKRQWYRVKTTFNYKNGQTGGILSREVNSRKAIQIQVNANRQWLRAKGHAEIEVTIDTCENPNQ